MAYSSMSGQKAVSPSEGMFEKIKPWLPRMAWSTHGVGPSRGGPRQGHVCHCEHSRAGWPCAAAAAGWFTAKRGGRRLTAHEQDFGWGGLARAKVRPWWWLHHSINTLECAERHTFNTMEI